MSVDQNTELLDWFMLNDGDSRRVQRLLLDAAAPPATGRQSFVFNIANVVLDLDAGVVELEHDLDPSESGSARLSLELFRATLEAALAETRAPQPLPVLRVLQRVGLLSPATLHEALMRNLCSSVEVHAAVREHFSEAPTPPVSELISADPESTSRIESLLRTWGGLKSPFLPGLSKVASAPLIYATCRALLEARLRPFDEWDEFERAYSRLGHPEELRSSSRYNPSEGPPRSLHLQLREQVSKFEDRLEIPPADRWLETT